MVNTKELAFLILFVMLFTLILCVAIILLARNNRRIQELSEQLIKEGEEKKELEKLGVAVNTQEEERSKIARILHDDVGALLSLAQKNLSNIHQKAEQGMIDKSTIVITQEYLQDCIDQLRQITKGLIPHYLLKFGLVKALERMVKQKTDSFVEMFKFTAKIPNNLVISDLIMTHYFYVASELITNLLKHSYPTSIEMRLTYEQGHLKMKIKHNGIALTQRDFHLLAADTDSLGLENIRYRLYVINGDLLFKRYKSFGTIELDTKLE